MNIQFMTGHALKKQTQNTVGQLLHIYDNFGMNMQSTFEATTEQRTANMGLYASGARRITISIRFQLGIILVRRL